MALIEIKIVGSDGSGAAFNSAAEGVRGIGEAAGQSQSKLSGFFSFMGGAALGGVAAIGGGFVAAATAGLGFNNSMEQARAKINAFTKDGDATTEILEMVADRAAKTPFAFEEMAQAAAGLGPAAKSAGIPLENLIEQAEVLAASNPSEGLVGATFALKEALSGDYASAIERFNLSRSYINQLKAEGVPALEIVRQAMAQAGYDTGLVAEMANTAQGRWSTFMDTWTTLAGMVTQPIFDAFSAGLGQANDLLTQMSPVMIGVAQSIAGFISQLIAGQGPAAGLLAALQPVVDFLQANWQPIAAAAAAIIGVGLAGAIATAVAALAGIIAAAAPVIAILAAIGVAGAMLQTAWSSNFMNIQGITASAMAAIQSVVQSVLGVVLAFWNENGAQIMAFASTTWTTIQTIVGTIAAGIAQIVTNVFGGIAQFINTHGAEIQSILSFAWNSVQNIITLALNVIQGITNTVLGVLTGNWTQASDGIKQIVGGLGTFLTDQFNNIVSLIQGIGPSVLSAAKEIGQAIIDGIVGGISAGASAIADAAKDAAQSAFDAAKSLLGIHSPSKLFATQVGLPIAQGLAFGIVSGAPLVASAAGSLAAGAANSARESVRRESDRRHTVVNVGGMTINQQPGQRGDQLASETARKLLSAAEMRR